MSDDQPYFRFNPQAYEEGRSFKRSNETCGVCARPCIWQYSGNIYAKERPTVCARCIANATLSQFLGNDYFSLHDINLGEADPILERELLERTPGVACFNPFDWPVLDRKPLAFLGYGDNKSVLANGEAQTAIKLAFDEMGWEFEPATPTPYALVFKEIDGDRYRVAIDLD